MLAGAGAGALALAFLALGIELVGLAVALLLGALGLADPGLEGSVGERLAGGLVVAVLGWFFLGVAWEGLIGFAPRPGRWGADQLAVAWLLAVLAVGAGLTALGWLAGNHAGPLWPGLFEAGLLLWSTGWAGLSGVPVVVGILWALERLWPRVRWEAGRLPVLLAAWAIVAMLLFGWARGAA